MCIAIVIPPHTVVPDEVMQLAAKRNRNGCGFAFVNSVAKSSARTVVIKRWATSEGEDLDNMMSSYKRILKKTPAADYHVLMHFRIATAGTVIKDNAHPFPIRHGALIHNGTLFHPVGGVNAPRSDTRIFAEAYEDKLTPEFVQLCKPDLERAIDRWNKIAMMWNDGTVQVLNESAWVRDAATGILYSHSGYK